VRENKGEEKRVFVLSARETKRGIYDNVLEKREFPLPFPIIDHKGERESFDILSPRTH
jgi:hypothetical protein